MSKLCCPVCWDLLSLLNDNGPPLSSFPRCHHIVYPVELPGWLPISIVEEMIRLYDAHLRRELIIMVEDAEDRDSRRDVVIQKKGHVSHESESNISVASTTRDIDDDPEVAEWKEKKKKKTGPSRL